MSTSGSTTAFVSLDSRLWGRTPGRGQGVVVEAQGADVTSPEDVFAPTVVSTLTFRPFNPLESLSPEGFLGPLVSTGIVVCPGVGRGRGVGSEFRICPEGRDLGGRVVV